MYLKNGVEYVNVYMVHNGGNNKYIYYYIKRHDKT